MTPQQGEALLFTAIPVDQPEENGERCANHETDCDGDTFACRILAEMATFADAGVSGPQD